jgi:hypothetical protein
MREPNTVETRQIHSHTIVALVGLLAGILIGAVFTHSSGVSHNDAAPPVPRPRALEPTR